jgi:hypothetical protein
MALGGISAMARIVIPNEVRNLETGDNATRDFSLWSK